MPIFCIPKAAVDKLKQSALAGEVDIKKLYTLSSKERRDFFIKHTDPDLGQFINAEFEKAMVSKQKRALTGWAESVFSPMEKKKPTYQTMLDKINNLDDLGVLNPKTEKAFLEDLVSDKLGINVSPDEVRAISQRAKAIDDAQVKLGDDLGNPLKTEENLSFFIAKKQMDDYLTSLNPDSKLRVLTGTVGRGMMLASVKSPILNIGSNIEVGITEGIGRRIATRGLRGADNSLAKDYIKMVNRVYQKTGYDLSRMTSVTDTGASGSRVLDDIVHTQGKGVVRKTGQVVEDVVFKQLMGAPDVLSGSLHFADSVNLTALKMSKGNKAEAQAVMQDALRLEPKTAQGEALRAQGIFDAQVATWTNKSWASQLTVGIRKIFNDLSGDLRLGDYLLPFVKTPANVIATGMDYAGLGIPRALLKTVKAIRSGELKDKNYIQAVSRDLVRAGMGMTGAAIIAMNLEPDDFMGAYDPARAQIEQLKNSRENSIRIGGKWISTDWFGPLAIPLTGTMYARKYGNNKGETDWQYAKGLKAGVMNLPGVKDAADFYRNDQYKKQQTSQEAKEEAQNYVTEQAASRLTPSVLSDIANATDPYDREGSKGVQGIKRKIPGLRQSLPVKRNIFGEPQKGESPAVEILFGGRVKTNRENRVVKEVDRVSKVNDTPINFTDWNKSSSKALVEFQNKVGKEKFDKAKIEYGKSLKDSLQSLFGPGSGYSDLSDADKLKVIRNRDDEAKNRVFKSYGFKPSKSKSQKIKL